MAVFARASATQPIGPVPIAPRRSFVPLAAPQLVQATVVAARGVMARPTGAELHSHMICKVELPAETGEGMAADKAAEPVGASEEGRQEARLPGMEVDSRP